MKYAQIALIVVVASTTLLTGCRMSSGDREARHLAVGQRHMEKRDYARAVLEFRNAVKAAPKSPDVHYYLGLALLSAGDAVAGVRELIQATELDPKHVAAQAKLSELMMTSRNPEVLEEARKRAEAAIAANPDDVASLDAMALASWNQERPEDSEQLLERALQRVPGHLKSAVMLARIRLATKDYTGAEEVLRNAAEANASRPEPRHALGAFYRLLKKNKEAEVQFQQAIQSDPQYGPALLELAQLRVLDGRKDEADGIYRRISALPDPAYRPAHALFLLYLVDAKRGTEELEKLHRADPKNRDVRTRLVAAYFAQKRWTDAEKVLAEAISKNAADVAALMQRAELLTVDGRYQDAEQDVLKALQADATMAAGHVLLARIYAARGEPLRQRQELAEAVRLNPTSLATRLSLANEYLRSGGSKAALELLNQAPDYQRGSADYMKARGWALLETGAYDEAGKLVQSALTVSKDPEFTLQAANLRLRQRDVAGARKLLESILKDSPSNLAALQALGQTYAVAGQLPAGVQQIKQYAARQPGSAAVQMLLATWMRRTGDVPGARAAAQAAVAADAKSVPARLMCVELEILKGDLNAARGHLNSLSPEQQSRAEAQMLFALTEQYAGNYSQSMEHLRKVLAVAPKSIPALNNLAYLLVDYAARPDEGLKYAQQVMELAPEDDRVEDTIGWAFYAKGLYPTAVSHLERAVSRNGKAAIPRYHLAMAYQKSGQREKAQVALAAATRLDPKAPERKRVVDLLSEGAQ